MYTTIPKNSDKYRIKLSDGQNWILEGCNKSQDWIDKLASILGLRNYYFEDFPKMIFKNSILEDEKVWMEENGWIKQIHNTSGFLLNRVKGKYMGDKNKSIVFWRHSGTNNIICDIGEKREEDIDYLKMWLSQYPLFKQAVERGGFPFHAGFIKKDEKAFLLAASGGIGKTTCCRRIPATWESPCDDEVLITKVKGKGYFVHPFPSWSDYIFNRPEKITYQIEDATHLRAIYFLIGSNEERIVPLESSEAVMHIYSSAFEPLYKNVKTFERNERNSIKTQLFNNVCELAKEIPAFKLYFSLKGKYWEKIEDAIV